MKKFVLAGVAAAAFCCAPAIAAPPAAPIFNWTGFYVGGNVGYGSADSKWNFISGGNFSFPGITATEGTTGVKGALEGAQAGYNWQNGQYLFGLEGTWEHSDIGGANPAPNGLATTTWSTNVKDLWTFAARLGITEGATLIYLKGGVAGATVDTSATRVTGIITYTIADAQQQIGWIIGFGGEHMLTPNWTIGGELDYVDLGSKTHSSTEIRNGVPNGTDSFSDKVKVWTGLIRLNYKFGMQ
jgi:outer membrane immunogenic protein